MEIFKMSNNMNELVVMPHDLQAEASVLGAIFINNEVLVAVQEHITYQDFYKHANQLIFKAFVELADKGDAIDATTVKNILETKGDLQSIGGITALLDVISAVPTSVNAEYYAKIVADKSSMRKLISAMDDLKQKTFSGEFTVSELVDRAEKEIVSIGDNFNRNGFQRINEVLSVNCANIEARSMQSTDITGISTGYYELDKITTGLHKDELIIIGARPAVGKTAFALNIAQNIATKSNLPVAIFSLEMGAESLVDRMLASESLIDAYTLRTGNLTDNDWIKLTVAQGILAQSPIYIDDTAGIKISEIRGRCRKLSKEVGGLGLIVIDYLQLITGHQSDNRQQVISDISRQLKILAKELKVPVIALSQLSRGVEQRQDKRPVLSDIRESGSIEQDADIVAFLYRDDYYERGAKNGEEEQNSSNIVEVIIEKNRSGARGTVELMFQKEYNKFSSISWRESEKG